MRELMPEIVVRWRPNSARVSYACLQQRHVHTESIRQREFAQERETEKNGMP